MKIPGRIRAAASEIGPTSLFRVNHCSLNDFVGFIKGEVDEHVVAGKIISYFCTDDTGAYNRFVNGIRLCLLFLTNGFDIKPDELMMAGQDLIAIVTNSTQDLGKCVEDWARSHF